MGPHKQGRVYNASAVKEGWVLVLAPWVGPRQVADDKEEVPLDKAALTVRMTFLTPKTLL